MDPFPVNSSVIFPLPPDGLAGVADEADEDEAAADVAYWATRFSKNPAGEAERPVGLAEANDEEPRRSAAVEERRSEARSLREAMVE